MKRIITSVILAGAVFCMQGCVSTASEESVHHKSSNPNQYYIDKGVHFLCHKEEDAMEATRTLIYMNIHKGDTFIKRNLCIAVSTSEHVKVKRTSSKRVLLDGVSVPVDRVKILLINGEMPPKEWSNYLWMVDALEDYTVKK